jgi:hypothetical protein
MIALLLTSLWTKGPIVARLPLRQQKAATALICSPFFAATIVARLFAAQVCNVRGQAS